MKQNFELDSYGRNIYPVRSYIIQEDLAVRVDLRTLEALAQVHNVPHFVIRDVKDVNGLSRDVIKKLRSLHFAHIPTTGLVITYAAPDTDGEAVTKLAGTELEVRTPPSDSIASFSHLNPLQRESSSVLRSLTEG